MSSDDIMASGSSQGDDRRGSKKQAMDILMRLANALDVDGGARADDDGAYDEEYTKGGKAYASPLDTYQSQGRTTIKTQKAKPVEEDDEDDVEEQWEYTATRYDQLDDVEAARAERAHFAPVPEDTVLPSQIPEGYDFRKYDRKTKKNWGGIAAVSFYTLALIVYFFVRVTKTMDLGRYLPYGIIVFIIEMCGATTTLIYGANLVLDPVSEDPVPDESSDVKGMIKVRVPYHVRVLVPCYSEPLEIVAKTCIAAATAYLPYGCRVTVYLCDDGKDRKKRNWVMNGPGGRDYGVIYVSGRTRASGEMNGKSANLNNCMKQLYTDGKGKDLPIPPNEIVCVFDADQVANPDFFLKTLYKLDAGDDVAMVLSPQAFYNTRLNADIFNHSNIHFWEYAQHGYDALGFISCTGTNFLIRAAAFRDAGWSPEYTLTEDFALGMELKKKKWECRYVEEYLVVGEAPEQVRNCFQQRSRWCKGHFQIVFGPHNPLLQQELSWPMRIMYCSGVWSYFVGAMTTPLFMLIPLLTIWAGMFPIVVSKWAAGALTVYVLGQSAVLNFMHKRSHAFPIFFATIANNILWWTFVKACWKSLLSLIPGRAKITFKTTMKGAAGRLANSALGDLWMPTASFIALAVTLGIGIKKLAHGPTVITTLSISIVWIVYSMIPPTLLLIYATGMRGRVLAAACKVAFVLTYVSSLLALMLLWAVYPAEYDYGAAAGASLKFYEASRLGELPAGNRIAFRGSTFPYERAPRFAFDDLTGGWANGGAVGTVKMTVTTAFTTTMLAWGLLTFPKGYARAGETKNALAAVKWGSDYLLKTFHPETGARGGYAMVYQVGNLTLDYSLWTSPENMTETQVKRPAYVVHSGDGASDLAGQLVGALVSSALVFKEYGNDTATYDKLMTAAGGLYKQATRHEGSYTSKFKYDCTSKYARARVTAKAPRAACPPPTAFAKGSALVYYNSTSYRDDLLWAAAWMYRATNDTAYLADVNKYYGAHVDLEGDTDAALTFGWDNVFFGANVLLAQLTDEGAFHVAVQDMLKQWICSTTGKVLFTPRGRAWNRASPTTGGTGNAALLSLIYGQLASKSVPHDKRDRYTCFARAQMRYLLGDGGRSLMVGYGKRPPVRAQSRSAACPKAPAACDKVRHLFGPGANPNVLTGAVVEFPTFDDAYPDVRASNDSRVSIENNAGITSVLAGLNQATGTWDQCLQGFGVLTRDRAVCDAQIWSDRAT